MGKNKGIPNWFKGVVYKKGGNVKIDRDGLSSNDTIYLDAHALSVYHLINGYKVMGENNNIIMLQSIDWFRDNYSKEAAILFPIDKERKKWKKRMDISIKKLKDNNYRIFRKNK